MEMIESASSPCGVRAYRPLRERALSPRSAPRAAAPDDHFSRSGRLFPIKVVGVLEIPAAAPSTKSSFTRLGLMDLPGSA